ncbi:unnamed protein product [Protopolystoma xenopodis]|uniref:Uncharacterized protein n=1 Tax=Protopolystoma xenopodis TaxID=117903 RepID=A0A448XAY1_9PLAT|nr:unnamed protein product [Protopolystoma xenopodis]
MQASCHQQHRAFSGFEWAQSAIVSWHNPDPSLPLFELTLAPGFILGKGKLKEPSPSCVHCESSHDNVLRPIVDLVHEMRYRDYSGGGRRKWQPVVYRFSQHSEPHGFSNFHRTDDSASYAFCLPHRGEAQVGQAPSPLQTVSASAPSASPSPSPLARSTLIHLPVHFASQPLPQASCDVTKQVQSLGPSPQSPGDRRLSSDVLAQNSPQPDCAPHTHQPGWHCCMASLRTTSFSQSLVQQQPEHLSLQQSQDQQCLQPIVSPESTESLLSAEATDDPAIQLPVSPFSSILATWQAYSEKGVATKRGNCPASNFRKPVYTHSQPSEKSDSVGRPKAEATALFSSVKLPSNEDGPGQREHGETWEEMEGRTRKYSHDGTENVETLASSTSQPTPRHCCPSPARLHSYASYDDPEVADTSPGSAFRMRRSRSLATEDVRDGDYGCQDDDLRPIEDQTANRISSTRRPEGLPPQASCCDLSTNRMNSMSYRDSLISSFEVPATHSKASASSSSSCSSSSCSSLYGSLPSGQSEHEHSRLHPRLHFISTSSAAYKVANRVPACSGRTDGACGHTNRAGSMSANRRPTETQRRSSYRHAHNLPAIGCSTRGSWQTAANTRSASMPGAYTNGPLLRKRTRQMPSSRAGTTSGRALAGSSKQTPTQKQPDGATTGRKRCPSGTMSPRVLMDTCIEEETTAPEVVSREALGEAVTRSPRMLRYSDQNHTASIAPSRFICGQARKGTVTPNRLDWSPKEVSKVSTKSASPHC